jgi:heptosyltransferase-2
LGQWKSRINPINTLIIKLGAAGDVVRTTSLLGQFRGHITWLTSAKNTVLLTGLASNVRCFSWEERANVLGGHYDLVINLEDSLEVALYLRSLEYSQLFGAFVDTDGKLSYTDDSKAWFDLSLISSYGREKADRLKFRNRQTYQELIFNGLGLQFTGEGYVLPQSMETGLSGDVAIAADSGAVWPMKKWAYYDELKRELEKQGLTANVLPKRSSLLEHLCDVRNHRCLVGGDSLPMHFALGTGTPCITLFTCTSPWEIYDYGIQIKIVSPLLEEFFYKRSYDARATTAISVNQVLSAVMAQLGVAISVDDRITAR